MNERNNFILIEELFFKNLNETAYNYENVIKKIKVLELKGFVILGGDVIKYDGVTAKYTYDNWYFNPDEYSYDILKYSAQKAIDYIEKYNEIDKDCFYSLCVEFQGVNYGNKKINENIFTNKEEINE